MPDLFLIYHALKKPSHQEWAKRPNASESRPRYEDQIIIKFHFQHVYCEFND